MTPLSGRKFRRFVYVSMRSPRCLASARHGSSVRRPDEHDAPDPQRAGAVVELVGALGQHARDETAARVRDDVHVGQPEARWEHPGEPLDVGARIVGQREMVERDHAARVAMIQRLKQVARKGAEGGMRPAERAVEQQQRAPVSEALPPPRGRARRWACSRLRDRRLAAGTGDASPPTCARSARRPPRAPRRRA